MVEDALIFTNVVALPLEQKLVVLKELKHMHERSWKIEKTKSRKG